MKGISRLARAFIAPALVLAELTGALTGCASADDIHSAKDLADYMANRGDVACVDTQSIDTSGAQFVICFSKIFGSNVRLEYFDDQKVGDAAEAMLSNTGWMTSRGARWIIATDGSAEGQSIRSDSP